MCSVSCRAARSRPAGSRVRSPDWRPFRRRFSRSRCRARGRRRARRRRACRHASRSPHRLWPRPRPFSPRIRPWSRHRRRPRHLRPRRGYRSPLRRRPRRGAKSRPRSSVATRPRAAALVGGAGEGVALPPRALSLLAVEPRVAGLAGTLGAFGILEPAVLTDATGAARIYVFREPGREAEWLGELALAVWEGLGRARDADLGALVSVVFRQGRRRILVRSLGRRGTVLLAAAGPVAR